MLPNDTTPRDIANIRLLALDVDGTLLTSEHRISQPTRYTIRAAHKAGLHVVLASARSPRALRPLLAELELRGYVVAFAGGLVCHLDANSAMKIEIISERRLDLESAKLIVRQALEQGVSIGWFEGETWYIPAWDATIQREAAILGIQPILTPNLTTLPLPPYKLQCMVADEIQAGKLRHLLHNLPADCTGQFSHSTYLEVIPSGIDKATGLEQLGSYLGIPLHDMAAIGDGENDLSMLRGVGLSIAMGNASSIVQRAAAWVTASNDEDGVAIAIEQILAGKEGEHSS